MVKPFDLDHQIGEKNDNDMFFFFYKSQIPVTFSKDFTDKVV